VSENVHSSEIKPSTGVQAGSSPKHKDSCHGWVYFLSATLKGIKADEESAWVWSTQIGDAQFDVADNASPGCGHKFKAGDTIGRWDLQGNRQNISMKWDEACGLPIVVPIAVTFRCVGGIYKDQWCQYSDDYEADCPTPANFRPKRILLTCNAGIEKDVELAQWALVISAKLQCIKLGLIV
jgi:hypothetical protein